MNMLYLLISMMFTLLFFYFSNPISLGLILICQSISLAMFMGSMTNSFWFLYLLILIFIGGMLVLFIYVTSIFPNEKFNFNQYLMTIIMMTLFVSTIYLVTYKYFFSTNMPLNTLFLEYNSSDNLLISPSLKMFSSQTNMMLIFMINYLFYCMIVVVKITNFMKGPLRSMKYV